MSLSLGIGRFKVKAMRNQKRIRDAVVVKMVGAIVLDNPVDTGRSRANWNTNAGSPDISTSESTDQSRAGRVARAAVKTASGEDTVHITNNLDYVYDLEKGSSKQAPQGMMRKNVLRFQRLVDSAARQGRLNL